MDAAAHGGDRVSVPGVALAALWCVALVAAAAQLRRAATPTRGAELLPGRAGAPEVATPARPRRDPLATLGRALRRIVAQRSRRSSRAPGDREPGAPGAGAPGAGDTQAGDRLLGAGCVLAVLLAALGHPVGGALVAAATGFARWRARRRALRRGHAEVAEAVPELADLFVVAVSAGCTAERGVRAVAPRAPLPVRGALQAAVRRLDRGSPFPEVLELLAADLGDEVRALTSVLRASHLDGVALAPALDRLATEARRQRRRRAEVAARRLPVTLLVPLVVCTLPAFGLLTVVPVLLSTLGALR